MWNAVPLSFGGKGWPNMNERPENTDWIEPGAEVIVYVEGARSGRTYPKRTTVARVARVADKSFTLDGITERISLDTLRSKRLGGTWDFWWYAVVKPDSDKGRELLAQKRLDALNYAARKATDEWNTGNGRTDVGKLNAAIAALQAYRSALTETFYRE